MDTKTVVSVLLLSAFVGYSHQLTVDDVLEAYAGAVNSVKQDCLKESGANPDDIENVIKHAQFSEDRKTKCFWKCFFRMLDLSNDNDEIFEESIKTRIFAAPDKVAEVHKKCAPLRGADICESTFAISKCIYETSIAAAKEG